VTTLSARAAGARDRPGIDPLIRHGASTLIRAVVDLALEGAAR
jgi:hypothetical protein